MRKGWSITRLGNVCEFDKAQGLHRDLPYVGLEHIESQTGRFIGSTEPIDVKSLTFKFSPEHVLYGRLRPYLNKVLAPDFSGHCSTEIFPIKPSSKLSRDYLFYWLLSDDTVERIDATSTGARMPRANMHEVLDFDFPVPPLAEQQRIVAILDEAFDAIATAKANTEKNLRNARALFDSYLESVFTHRGEGWKQERLHDICVLQRGFDLPTRTRQAGNYPVVSSSGVIDTHSEGPVKGPGIATGRSGSIGSIFYIDGDFWPLNTVLYVKEFHGNYPKFVYWLLRHFRLERFASGAGVPTLNRNFVHGEHVVVPDSMSAQIEIAARLDELNLTTQHLESIYQGKLDALDELKKSLLHQAFNGELTAQPERLLQEAVA